LSGRGGDADLPILPNAAAAVINPGKLTGYCLDPTSPGGRHKARVFKAALGFDLSNWRDLLSAIHQGILVHEAEPQGGSLHGERWRVDIIVVGPAGRATVRTVWLYGKDSDVPRLITAYVIGRI
jgi:hypothetical protein